jgi:hypothetical protein
MGTAIGISGVLFIVLYGLSLAWVYRDANSRGMRGWLVLLLVAFLGWPLSLIFWIALRPIRSTPLPT